MLDRRLIHYSIAPLKRVYSTKQAEFPNGNGKPRGLWVSAEGDDDWPSWCRSEEFGNIDAKVGTEVVLRDDANILVMSLGLELDDFTRQYLRPADSHFPIDEIDWARVAVDWSGIIIAPYIWSRRLHQLTRWYYGWDCASGCIWDAKAVVAVAPIAADAL